MSENMKHALDWLNEIITNPEGWQMFYSASEMKSCAEAALALLKEQEPMAPVYDQLLTQEIPRCGKCGYRLVKENDKYCCKCGRAVKWE